MAYAATITQSADTVTLTDHGLVITATAETVISATLYYDTIRIPLRIDVSDIHDAGRRATQAAGQAAWIVKARALLALSDRAKGQVHV